MGKVSIAGASSKPIGEIINSLCVVELIIYKNSLLLIGVTFILFFLKVILKVQLVLLVIILNI